MKLIIPAAGKSTRFPDMPPKWTLNHPNGNMMIIEAIKGLPLKDFEFVYITVLKEHYYLVWQDLHKELKELLGDKYFITLLEEPTSSQSETIAKTIGQNNITGPVMIKDSDNYFGIDSIEGNSVCVDSLYSCGKINAGNKSYVQVGKDGAINNIIEKSVISSTFCVGGYSFNDAQQFVKVFKRLNRLAEEEIYVSHIIFDMILDGETFTTNDVKDYKDWGTLEDWNDYLRTFKSDVSSL